MPGLVKPKSESSCAKCITGKIVQGSCINCGYAKEDAQTLERSDGEVIRLRDGHNEPWRTYRL